MATDVGLRAKIAPEVDERKTEREMKGLKERLSEIGEDWSISPSVPSTVPTGGGREGGAIKNRIPNRGQVREGVGRATGDYLGNKLPTRAGTVLGESIGATIRPDSMGGGDSGGGGGSTEGPTDAETGQSLVDLAIERNELLQEILEELQGGLDSQESGDQGLKRGPSGKLLAAGGAALGLAALIGGKVAEGIDLNIPGWIQGDKGLPLPIPNWIENPGGIPLKVPEGLPTDIPVTIPDELPGDIPVEIPDELPTDIPVEIPEGLPTDIPVKIPDGLPTEIPVEVPDWLPIDIPKPGWLWPDIPKPDWIPIPVGKPKSSPDDSPDESPDDSPFPNIEAPDPNMILKAILGGSAVYGASKLLQGGGATTGAGVPAPMVTALPHWGKWNSEGEWKESEQPSEAGGKYSSRWASYGRRQDHPSWMKPVQMGYDGGRDHEFGETKRSKQVVDFIEWITGKLSGGGKDKSAGPDDSGRYDDKKDGNEGAESRREAKGMSNQTSTVSQSGSKKENKAKEAKSGDVTVKVENTYNINGATWEDIRRKVEKKQEETKKDLEKKISSSGGGGTGGRFTPK